MSLTPPHPQKHEEWGQCDSCGFDFPVSQLRRHPRWGWQCKDDWDGSTDREQQRASYKFRSGEGVRRSTAPRTNTDTEGVE